MFCDLLITRVRVYGGRQWRGVIVAGQLAEWAIRRIILDGRPFRFAGHAYLKAIYDDTSRHIVLSKAAQIGGTTWAILRSLHACFNGLNVVYYFPTRTEVIEFSKSRVTPLLGDNPFLAEKVQDTDTAGLKRLGEGHLYFRGMQSTVGLKSVPADMVVFDELDEAAPEAKAMARERLAHSSYKRILELSNPSLPDYGIDEAFQVSDQRHWTLKCSRCGEWTALDKEFPKKTGEQVPILVEREDGSAYRACRICQAELDLEEGEWVADFPSQEIHGYRISQLFSPTVDPAEILREYRTTGFPARFYNLKIGIPWSDSGRRVTEVDVLALCRTDEAPEISSGECFMGVDTGRELHVVVLQEDEDQEERFGLLHVGTYGSFDDLDSVLAKYGVDHCVIDGLPETHATREFADRHRGVVSMSFFSEHQHGKPRWDRKEQKVIANRTEMLDASRNLIREERLVLPRRTPQIVEFAKHVGADAKILDEDAETGRQRYRYIRTGADHYSMALTYALMAAEDTTGARGWLRYARQVIRQQALEE